MNQRGINVNFFIYFIYFLSIYFLSSLLNKKYKIIDKFQDKNNKSFKRIVNISSFISIIIVLTIPLLDKYFETSVIYIPYLQGIFAIPFLIKMYIKNIISQKKIIEKVNNKDKDKEIKIDYCYYCGSELEGSNICPSCGKELVL